MITLFSAASRILWNVPQSSVEEYQMQHWVSIVTEEMESHTSCNKEKQCEVH